MARYSSQGTAAANKRRVGSGSQVGGKSYGRVNINPKSKPVGGRTKPGPTSQQRLGKRMTDAQKSGGVRGAWDKGR